MLSKYQCPHTGVVNYFTKADPLLAVGSVAKAGQPRGFAWRCYVGEETCGLASDMALAEAELKKAVARVERQIAAERKRRASRGLPGRGGTRAC
jgi:hypothetical protein